MLPKSTNQMTLIFNLVAMGRGTWPLQFFLFCLQPAAFQLLQNYNSQGVLNPVFAAGLELFFKTLFGFVHPI